VDIFDLTDEKFTTEYIKRKLEKSDSDLEVTLLQTIVDDVGILEYPPPPLVLGEGAKLHKLSVKDIK